MVWHKTYLGSDSNYRRWPGGPEAPSRGPPRGAKTVRAGAAMTSMKGDGGETKSGQPPSFDEARGCADLEHSLSFHGT